MAGSETRNLSFLADLLEFCGFWRLHGDPEQMQPDTVVPSLAALLTRLTQSGAKWWMLPGAGLATLRRGPRSWTWALNSSFEGLSSAALKSNCFDRPGSHSHQPGENLMISIFIRSTYIKKGPSAVLLSTLLCLHLPPTPLSHRQPLSYLLSLRLFLYLPFTASEWRDMELPWPPVPVGASLTEKSFLWAKWPTEAFHIWYNSRPLAVSRWSWFHFMVYCNGQKLGNGSYWTFEKKEKIISFVGC